MIEFIMLLMLGAAVSVQDIEINKKDAQIAHTERMYMATLSGAGIIDKEEQDTQYLCGSFCESYVKGEINRESYQKGYYAGSKKCKKDSDIIRALRKDLALE